MIDGGGTQSTSSSSSSTSDTRVGASDSGIAIGGGAQVQITTVEPETLRLIAHALPEISGQVFDLAKVVISGDAAKLERTLAFARDARQSEDTNTMQQFLRLGAMVAVAALALKALA